MKTFRFPRISAYLASPLGFAESTKYFMENVYVPALKRIGILTVNPWDLTTDAEIAEVMAIADECERAAALAKLHQLMGSRNRTAIDRSNFVIANLDGQEIDSGTAAEVGFAVGRGKVVFGYRSDFRNNGEPGARVNLQVEHFILESGGQIAASLEELVCMLERFLSDYASTLKIAA